MTPILASAKAPNDLNEGPAPLSGQVVGVEYTVPPSAKSSATVLSGKTNETILLDDSIDIGSSDEASDTGRSADARHTLLADAASPAPAAAPSVAIGEDPAIGNDAMSRDYLRAARADLVAGRTGEAQQSLKLAQRRALDQAAVPGRTATPNTGLFIARIIDARRALENGDSHYAIALIDVALLH